MILPEKLTIHSECYEREICTILEYFVPQCHVVNTERECASIDFRHTEEFAGHPEKYRITISAQSPVIIEYCEYQGLSRAIADLSQRLVYDGGNFTLDEVCVEEEPVSEHRGVMLDLARGIKDYEILCEDVVFIAKCRMNYLHLHLFDDKGVCFQMDSVPTSCYIEYAYTKEQMRDLCSLANLLGLEVIPEFDMPAHATGLLEALPELHCDAKEQKETRMWAVCAGSEHTYQLYERIIHELTEVFTGSYIHIGGDELEFSDIPEPLFCHWENCSMCRSLCEREHISGKREIYYYFINRIYEIVKREGRRMIMWSDQLDCMHPVNIPKDVIMHFWRVAAEGRGPTEGCSMQGQLEFGYQMINSYYKETYLEVEHHLSSETLRDWDWRTRPECDAKYSKQIIGSEICFWEYGNKEYSYYDRVLYPATAIMADKLWNGKELQYTAEYSHMLTRIILGAGVPKQLDIFTCLGDVIPPRTSDYAYYEKIRCSDATLKEILDILKDDFYMQGEKRRAHTYYECIEKVLEKRGESQK